MTHAGDNDHILGNRMRDHAPTTSFPSGRNSRKFLHPHRVLR